MKFRWCTLRFIPRLNHCVSYLWFFMVPKSIRQAKLDQIRPFRASSAFQVESVDWAFNSPSIGALYHKETLYWHSHYRLTTLTSLVSILGRNPVSGWDCEITQNRKSGNGVLGAIRLSVLYVSMQWINLWYPSRLEPHVAASGAEIVYQNPI